MYLLITLILFVLCESDSATYMLPFGANDILWGITNAVCIANSWSVFNPERPIGGQCIGRPAITFNLLSVVNFNTIWSSIMCKVLSKGLILRSVGHLRCTSPVFNVPSQGMGFQCDLCIWFPISVDTKPSLSTIRMLVPSAKYKMLSEDMATPKILIGHVNETNEMFHKF